MKKSYNTLLNLIMAVVSVTYVFVFLKIIIFKYREGTTVSEIYIAPFRLIGLYFSGELTGMGLFKNIFGNILIFAPFGILLPFYFKKLKLHYVVLIGFLLSLFLECTQYVQKVGTAEIDDIICNTIGTILGVLVFKFIREKAKSDFVKKLIISIILVIGGLIGAATVWIVQPELFGDFLTFSNTSILHYDFNSFDLSATSYHASMGSICIEKDSAKTINETITPVDNYYYTNETKFVKESSGTYKFVRAEDVKEIVLASENINVDIWVDTEDNKMDKCSMVLIHEN